MGEGAGIGAGGHGPQAQGSGNQGTGLGPMNFHKPLERDPFLFRIQIEDLSGDQSQAAGGMGELRDHGGARVAAIGFGSGYRSKGLGKQSITRQDRHSLAVNPVVCGAAAAEVVVIHARQVVVNEGVGVDAFDGAGGGQSSGLLSAGGTGGGEAENGAEPFPPGEKAVAHGLMNEARMGIFGNQPVERPFNQG